MNRGSFTASIRRSGTFLKKVGLDNDQNYYPSYPANPAAIFKDKGYLDLYKVCIESHYYHFQLIDGSIMQFHYNESASLKLGYSYFESPYTAITFDQYLKDAGFSEEIAEDERRQLASMYEEDLSSIAQYPVKNHPVGIRYDYDEATYNEGIHPVSHIHFGLNNNVRVGIKKIQTPLSFVLFIIRQCYPDHWSKFHSMKNSGIWSRHVRDSLIDIDLEVFWGDLDNRELILA